MKKNQTGVLLILLFMSIQSYSQTIDSAAVKIVEANLKIVNDYLKDFNSDPTHKRAGAISFLTRLTGVPSKSDGSFIGQLSPTQEDYIQWKKWLSFYKQHIKWDREKNVIIVNKEITPENIPSDL